MTDNKQISFFAHEADMVRIERINKRLTIITIILIVLFVTTNLFWIYKLIK